MTISTVSPDVALPTSPGRSWRQWVWDQEPVAVLITGVSLAAGLAVAVFVQSNQLLDLLFQVLLLATMATAWNIIGGFGGRLSLGHAVFYGLGAYSAGLLLLRAGISPLIGAWLGVLLAVLLGLLVGLAGLRLRGPFFAMATFVMGPAFQALATHLSGITGGSGGIGLPIRGEWYTLIFDARRPYVLLALLLFTVTLYITYHFRYSRFGIYLIAAGADPDAAASLGANVLWVRLGAMAVSAALTALCGVLGLFYTVFIDPENAFGAAISIKIVMVAVVGGTGSLAGPLLGAIVLVPMEQYLSNTFAGVVRGLSGFLFGLLLVVAVLIAPGGLAQGLDELRHRLRPRSTHSGSR